MPATDDPQQKPSPHQDQRLSTQGGPVQDDPEPPRKTRAWVWILILVLLALIIFAFWRNQHEAGSTATKGARRGFGPVTLTPATVEQGSIGVYLNALGTVTALHTVAITSQVTGVVRAVYYHEGQFVRRGQPLLEIDPRAYEAQVEQAEGIVKRDQALLAEARMNLVRYQRAWAENAIPRQTLDDQQKLVLQDEGTVENDQGVLAYDRVQLSYCYINSPIDGKVGLRLVDPGNLVTAGGSNTLVVVTTMDPITVIAPIAETSLPELLAQPGHGIGLPMQIWNGQNTQQVATGRITSLDNQIDTTTGTLKVRATVNNADGELYPNEFVNVRILVKTLTNQTLVPDSAVQHNGSKSFVYVLRQTPKGLIAQMQNVTTGATNGGIVVVHGLEAGERVANSSFEKLQDGAPVRTTTTVLPTTNSQSNIP